MKYISAFVFFLFLSFSVFANTSQLLQLVDYVGVDYAATVSNGQVINPAEYAEMQEFTLGIQQKMHHLPQHEAKERLLKQADKLVALIIQKAPPEQVKKLTSTIHQGILDAYNVVVVPRKRPNLQHAASLYQQNCIACHGEQGLGDGAMAAQLDPPPTNFHDKQRYRQRTLFGLFTTITQGVEGTAMPAFAQLTDAERWSLAFYVGSMAAKPPEQQPDIHGLPALSNLKSLTTTTPDQAEDLYGARGASAMAWLRHHPEYFYNNQVNLAFAKKRLQDSLASYQKKAYQEAYQYAVEAYLEGFELVEQTINAFDKSLRLEIEVQMTGLRELIREKKPYGEVALAIKSLDLLLGKANNLLGSRSLSGKEAFASAFFILLREGLEALLIVAALVAFLVRTKQREAIRYLHYGWIAALLLGGLTWWLSVSLIDISGASREVTEGVGALVAMVVLLYVGFWMHDKTSAARWKQFIDHNMQKALGSGTLWTLTGLSFIAVYREAFETILFYQALWAQSDEAGKAMGLSGFLTAVAVLAVLGVLIMRYSVRLPLRQFFSVTSGLMFVLAVIFAGKGIAALQEAGIIPSSQLSFIRIDLLGIYPNMQGLAAQAALILLALFLWNKKRTG